MNPVSSAIDLLVSEGSWHFLGPSGAGCKYSRDSSKGEKVQGPGLRRTPHLVRCSAVGNLKSFTMFQ